MNAPTASDGAVAWPWLGALGQLVCAAGARDLSREDQEAAISAAHWSLFNILRAPTAPPIDRAKLLALDFEAIVATELARHQSDGKWITGANTFARCIATELRALLKE